MSFEYIEVPVKNLHLDSENPRHIKILDESLIIKHLYENEKVPNLLKDVATRGFSPLDRIGVIPISDMPGHYVVVEGNRRICALKLLLDENLAPNEQIRTQVVRAKRLIQVPPPTSFLVCKFDSLEDALPWIDRRHLGAQSGVGTRNWGAVEQVRSLDRTERSSPTNSTAQQNALAQAIVNRVYIAGKISGKEQSMIPLTTLSRYLSTPAVRDVIGLAHNADLIYAFADDEVDEALKAFVMDSLPESEGEPPRLSSRSDATDRRMYALEFAERGLRPITQRLPSAPAELEKSEAETTNDPISSPSTELPQAHGKSNNSENVSAPVRLRGTKNPRLRPHLPSPDFSLTAPDDLMLVRLFKEMKRLHIEQHEFSANYLIRAFIERSMIRFLRFHKKTVSPNMTDSAITQACRNLADTLGANRNILDVLGRAASNQSCSYSLPALGGAIHCAHAPIKRDLIDHFDTWAPILKFIHENSL